MTHFRKVFALGFFLGALGLGTVQVQAIQVVDFSPEAQSFVPSDVVFIVDFDEAVDPVSVTGRSFFVFGRWTGVISGSFTYENGNQRMIFTPDKPFSAGEWVTVALSKGIANASGENMAKGFAWNFWTRTWGGNLDLEAKDTIEVRTQADKDALRPGEVLRTYGAYAGDLNGDGYQDFTVVNEDSDDIRVYINDQQGNFFTDDHTMYRLPGGAAPSTNEATDFNGDGYIDFVTGNIRGNSVSVLIGLGDGSGLFHQPVTYPVGNGTRGICVPDLNGDGFPDIVTANRASSNISVLMNNGDGTFADAVHVATVGDAETSCTFADVNGDGTQDVLIGSLASSELVVLLSDGDGNLTVNQVTNLGGSGWMIVAADMNGDGHVDVVSANSNNNSFSVLFGDGTGKFGNPTNYNVGSLPLAIDVGDLDGDNDLDVVVSNFVGGTWTIWENNGDGTFSNSRTIPASSSGSDVTLHDIDGDGDLDMTGIDEEDDLIFLFTNTDDPSGIRPNNKDAALLKDVQAVVGSNNVHLKFHTEIKKTLRVDLVNLSGKLLASRETAGAEKLRSVNLPTRGLSQGTYWLRIRDESQSLWGQKVVLLAP